MGFIQEFKEFAIKGNMVDMADGIVIGGAFGTLVNSLVSDVIMPPLGLLTSGINFTELKIILRGATTGPDGATLDPVAIQYGLFVQNILNFIIVAFSIFLVIKAINRMRKQKEAPAPAPVPAEPPPEIKLLTEIRDSLREEA